MKLVRPQALARSERRGKEVGQRKYPAGLATDAEVLLPVTSWMILWAFPHDEGYYCALATIFIELYIYLDERACNGVPLYIITIINFGALASDWSSFYHNVIFGMLEE